jgi:hypothetical protein
MLVCEKATSNCFGIEFIAWTAYDYDHFYASSVIPDVTHFQIQCEHVDAGKKLTSLINCHHLHLSTTCRFLQIGGTV